MTNKTKLTQGLSTVPNPRAITWQLSVRDSLATPRRNRCFQDILTKFRKVERKVAVGVSELQREPPANVPHKQSNLNAKVNSREGSLDLPQQNKHPERKVASNKHHEAIYG